MSANLGEYPVRWYEGMLLTAQHFYAQDAYWQERLRSQMRQAQPHGWGILALTIDPARLLEGYFAVTSLVAVMPDGRSAAFPPPDEADLDEAAIVAPTVPRAESLGLDLTKVLKTRPRAIVRLTSSPEENPIDYGGPGVLLPDEPPVEYLRPRLTLEEGAPVGQGSIALAEVCRDESGGYSLTSFHPPMLRLPAASFLRFDSLLERLRRLVADVRKKAARLAEKQGATSPAVAALMSALPQLEVVVACETAHPFEVYKALAVLVGHSAALRREGIPPAMAPYEHGNMFPGFDRALISMESLLEGLSLDFGILELEKRGASFSVFIEPAWEEPKWVIEVHPAAGQSLGEVAAWLRESKIGSASLLEVLHQRRTPGAQVTLASDEVVARYTLRGGAMFFVLHNTLLGRDDQRVSVIRGGEELVIEGPGDGKPPARILLYRDRVGAS
jgi:type VI secretion system protein ImpJ